MSRKPLVLDCGMTLKMLIEQGIVQEEKPKEEQVEDTSHKEEK